MVNVGQYSGLQHPPKAIRRRPTSCWSATDTFEWINDSGIAHVDFKTEKRTPKLSVSDRLESAFGPAAITARERTIIKGVIQMNCFRPGTGESRDRGPCTGCDSRSRGHLVGKGEVDRLRQQRSSSRLTSHFQFTARSRLRVHFRNRWSRRAARLGALPIDR